VNCIAISANNYLLSGDGSYLLEKFKSTIRLWEVPLLGDDNGDANNNNSNKNVDNVNVDAMEMEVIT